MNEIMLNDREEEEVATAIPYLSHSRVSRYILCPESYRLYYL